MPAYVPVDGLPPIGLCWGTIRQASLLELIELAAAFGFPTLSVPPHIIEQCLASGSSLIELRQRLADAGLRITVIDALTRDLPGAARIDEVPETWRANWKFGLDDLIAMAEALDAPTINVTHFLGKPVSVVDMAQAIAELAARAGQHGRALSLEFIPGTSLPSVGVAAHVIQLAGASNVGVMLDTWHLLRSGDGASNIRALPPGSLRGVQLNDRADIPQSLDGAVSERSLPGEGTAPLADILAAVVDNTPDVSIEIEVFSSELARLPPAAAARRAATALAAWRHTIGSAPE
jgi:sugar phosphate isomerase/epimerase